MVFNSSSQFLGPRDAINLCFSILHLLQKIIWKSKMLTSKSIFSLSPTWIPPSSWLFQNALGICLINMNKICYRCSICLEDPRKWMQNEKSGVRIHLDFFTCSALHYRLEQITNIPILKISVFLSEDNTTSLSKVLCRFCVLIKGILLV